MPAPGRDDPFKKFSFQVEIDGTTSIHCKSVSGLAAEAEVIEYRPGNFPVAGTRKLPGLVEYPNVTLTRGLTASTVLWDWWTTVRDGKVSRRLVDITLLDDAQKPVLRWRLFDAWIARIEFSELDASKSEVAIETIELAHEGLELEIL